jgi:hypothetical protein
MTMPPLRMISEAGAFLFHGLFYHYFTTTLYTVILVFIYWYLPLLAKPNITKNPHERWFSSIHASFHFGAREGI